jgi:hypothetical protein
MSGGGSSGGNVDWASSGATDQALSDEELAKLLKAREEAMKAQSANPRAGILASAAYRYAVPGTGSQQAQMLADQTADFGPSGLGATMDAASTAQGLSPTAQTMGNYGGKALGLLGAAGQRFDRAMNDPKRYAAMTMGLGLMLPGKPPPMGPQGRPAPEGPANLTSPYQNAKAAQVSGIRTDGPRPGETYADYLRRKAMGQ